MKILSPIPHQSSPVHTHPGGNFTNKGKRNLRATVHVIPRVWSEFLSHRPRYPHAFFSSGVGHRNWAWRILHLGRASLDFGSAWRIAPIHRRNFTKYLTATVPDNLRTIALLPTAHVSLLTLMVATEIPVFFPLHLSVVVFAVCPWLHLAQRFVAGALMGGGAHRWRRYEGGRTSR